MKEVVHLIDSGGLYGAERVLLHLMVEQQKQGRPVRLISYGSSGVGEKPLEAEARRLNLPLEAWRGRFWRRLKDELNRPDEPRIYHSHGYKFNILLALAGRVRKADRYVATLHGFTDAPRLSKLRLYYALNRWSLRHLDGVAFVSEQTACKAGIEPNGKAYRVIHNGIPEAEGVPQAAVTPQVLGLSGGYILALGRLSPEKGLDLLLKAFAHQEARHPNISLVIVGDGPEKKRLVGLTEALGLADRVHFTGYLAEPQALLEGARLLAIPSYQEGLPITLLEAMRAGIDVLASDVGEISRVTSKGQGARLVSAGDLGALTEAMDSALSAPEGQWGEVARDLFKQGYTASAMAEAYQRWYGAL